MSAKRSKVVRGAKGMRLTVYPWTHPGTGAGRWRFAWQDGGKWRYSTFKTKAEAEEGAAEKLEEIEVGGLVWSSLPKGRREFLAKVNAAVREDGEEAVLEYLQSRNKSGEISAAVVRFMAGKISAKGEKTPYLGHVDRVLVALGKSFSGKSVADVHLPALAEWLDARCKGKGWKTKKDARAYLVEFWKWCQRDGIAGREAVTVAERLPMVAGEDAERRVLSCDELVDVLANVGDNWRAWVVLGAFAGMRPQEICPAKVKKRGKRGLHREEIDWEFGVIRLPACVSKGGKRARIIPLSPALRAGLEWSGIKPGQMGPVVEDDPAKAGELKRIGIEVFKDGWPQDALRHSYGSYRNAIVRSLEQVAEEMGTSVAMLHRHYHNPKAEAEGKEWFEVRGAGDPICSDENGLTAVSSAFLKIAEAL